MNYSTKLSNQVQLIGPISGNPQIRVLPSGEKHARFSLATKAEYKDEQGNTVKETQWHNIVCWGEAAELCHHVNKGDSVALTGRLNHRDYTDKDGNRQYLTEVVANELLILS